MSLSSARAQDAAAQDSNAAPSALPATQASGAVATGNAVPFKEDKRAFGVLPNYRTAELSEPFAPISVKRKFTIASKDTFDWPAYILGGVFAGVSQLENSEPFLGQGLKGYAGRYWRNTADQDIGNFMTEAIWPSLLHEDPRYFRKGTGSIKGRIAYAASRVIICKTDKGTASFNFSEWLGNGSVASIGNIYYPDERGFGYTMQRMVTQVGTDAISQVLKEFWPDVKRRWFHKNNGASVTGD